MEASQIQKYLTGIGSNIFMTQEEKYEAIVEEIQKCKAQSAPVLVGTASIESSELLSGYLKKQKIDHKILNAKFHEKEAEIVCLVKDKKLTDMYKLTKANVAAAYPDIQWGDRS